MWQMIAKGVLGGIGGGLKEAGNSKTNLSGETKQNDTANDVQDSIASVGKIFGKVRKGIADKKKKEQENG